MSKQHGQIGCASSSRLEATGCRPVLGLELLTFSGEPDCVSRPEAATPPVSPCRLDLSGTNESTPGLPAQERER